VAVSTRTLVILRHAKAANPAGVIDIDRPLEERGVADATVAGEWIVHSGLEPDLVLCSPARRTRQTWHGVALSLTVAPKVRYEQLIYGASVRTLLATVRRADDDAATVLLIVHNPCLSELSAILDPDHAEDAGLRTAGIAVHSFTGQWKDCGTDPTPLVKAHTPRAQDSNR